MSLGLQGWDMLGIQMKMKNKSIYEIINLFREHERIMKLKSVDYLQAVTDNNEFSKKRIEEEFEQLEKEKCVIALHIVDELSKTSADKS